MNPPRNPITGDVNKAINTLYKPAGFIAWTPAAISAAPVNPPINACDELPGMPKYHVIRFHTIAPIKQAAIASNVNAPDSTTPEPIVLATTTPNRNGPKNSATAVIASAV